MAIVVWRPPSNAEILEIVAERVDARREALGVVVGVVDADGARIVAHGTLGHDDRGVPNGETLFEIGSITKVFTALLLAQMAGSGDVSLDDPIAMYLPDSIEAPLCGGEAITLTDLATHTSGLPRRPANLSRRQPADPYAGYRVDQLYRSLRALSNGGDLARGFRYSNLGMGLLGHVLALRAGVPFSRLLRERITDPLGMRDTAIELPARLKRRLAQGHDQSLRPTPHWRFGALAGAGALCSTASDLVGFLGAALGHVATPLASAMQAQLGVRRAAAPGFAQALGWRVSPDASGDVVWHGGETGGFRCHLLLHPQHGCGAVVLTNSASVGADDVGFHIVCGRPLQPRPPAVLGQTELDRYVGTYALRSGARLALAREGARIFARLGGQAFFELLPESDAVFRWRSVDATAQFEIDTDGRVVGLVLRQNGRDLSARRLDR